MAIVAHVSDVTHRSLVLHFNRLLKPDRLESAFQKWVLMNIVWTLMYSVIKQDVNRVILGQR